MSLTGQSGRKATMFYVRRFDGRLIAEHGGWTSTLGLAQEFALKSDAARRARESGANVSQRRVRI